MEHAEKESEKERIRSRYKGISQDMLETIPAVERVDILHDDTDKRVGVYVRVSTDDPRQTSSFELQRNHYTDLVDRYPNWHLVRIYADEGIPGTSLRHRKKFLEMIEDCRQAGERLPSLDMLLKLSSALNTTPDHLLLDTSSIGKGKSLSIEELLGDCTPHEYYILYENMSKLKAILREKKE